MSIFDRLKKKNTIETDCAIGTDEFTIEPAIRSLDNLINKAQELSESLLSGDITLSTYRVEKNKIDDEINLICNK